MDSRSPLHREHLADDVARVGGLENVIRNIERNPTKPRGSVGEQIFVVFHVVVQRRNSG